MQILAGFAAESVMEDVVHYGGGVLFQCEVLVTTARGWWDTQNAESLLTGKTFGHLLTNRVFKMNEKSLC